MLRALLVSLVALVGAGCSERDLEPSRRAHIAELVPADVNKDGVLDVIAGYAPSMADKPGTRFSRLEALDGKTGRALWTSRMRMFLDGQLRMERASAVGPSHVAFTHHVFPADDPGGDLQPALAVFELATGQLAWERTFTDARYWTGDPFRVWTHGDLLLAFVNTNNNDDRNARGDILRAFDFATGAERWTLRVEHVHTTPLTIGDTLVLSALAYGRGDDQILLVDAKTGQARRVGTALEREVAPVLRGDKLWIPCEAWDPHCVKQPDTRTRSERFQNDEHWLMQVDVAAATIAPLPLANGSPQPLPDKADTIAAYEDSVISIGRITDSTLARTPLGAREPRWTYKAAGVIALFDYANTQRFAPAAAYLHTIPGRYLPLYVTDPEASRLVILDLESGAVTWQSTPFERGAFHGFAVHGSRYYTNLRAADNTMLAINANTGKLDAVYQIAIGDDVDSPNALTLHDAPSPWSFQSGILFGHWRGAHYWMIDLETRRLKTASPGVKLLTPWQTVERVLGPVPRALVI